MMGYRLLCRLLRFALGVFFRRMEVVGLEHVPRQGPVLFCGNHPNALLDPALIVATCGRVVRFAAKDTLFRSPLLRPFLAVAGAVPVRRRSDHAEGALGNEEAFESLITVLTGGGAAGIFPEGISHEGSRLAGLKTGAARIALGAEGRRPGLGVSLIACGLHYVHRSRFRSSVLVQYGAPRTIPAALVEAYAADPRGASRRLTEDLERDLLALTVNADDWETLRVLDGVRRLYQPPDITLEQRVELARRFATHYPAVKNEPPVRRLIAGVEAYLDRLAALGLNDRDVQQPPSAAALFLRTLGHLALILFWLPLAAAGAWLHGPAAALLGFVAGRLASKDVVATVKLIAGILLLPLAYLGIPLLLGWRFGLRVGTIAFVLLPLSGLAMLHVVERASALTRTVKASARMLVLGREVQRLRIERDRLEREVVEAVERYRPETLEPLFPRSTAPSSGAGTTTISTDPA